jgi:hypothetical protein
MGIIEFERNRLRQQEIEVRALVALVEQEAFWDMRKEAAKKLYYIAFPDKLADRLEKEKWFTNEL